MTVFRAFLRVLNKNKGMVILYTVILVAFAAANMQTQDGAAAFTASRPKTVVVDYDKSVVSEGLGAYIEKKCDVNKKISGVDTEDALFYRQIDYVIYIPQGFGEDICSGNTPEIKVKSTGSYNASYAQMLVKKYIKTAEGYAGKVLSEAQGEQDGSKAENADRGNVIVKKTADALNRESAIHMTTGLDSDAMSRAAYYYNFANYSLIAGGILVVCLIVSSFREQTIRKRISVSSMNYKKHNRILIASNGLFILVLWAFYAALSFVLVGTDVMTGSHGAMFILNSFVFSINVLTMAFLLSNLLESKNAINGVVNVVALGSSFLCGCFVPSEWLPDIVNKVARAFPSYWYVDANNRLSKLETVSLSALKYVWIDMIAVIIFSVVFAAAANIISKMKQRN